MSSKEYSVLVNLEQGQISLTGDIGFDKIVMSLRKPLCRSRHKFDEKVRNNCASKTRPFVVGFFAQIFMT